MKRGNKRKFGRTARLRSAFLRSLAVALIQNRRISTTKARAKTLRSFVEKLVTVAKDKDVSARRQLASQLDPSTVKILVDEIASRYETRSGGYTRIVPLSRRRSDGSEMSIVEFIS